jgi:hypothetical protein
MATRKKVKRLVGEREIANKDDILAAAKKHGMDAERFSEMTNKDLELGYSALLAGIRRLLVEDKPVELHRIGVLVPGKRNGVAAIQFTPDLALLKEISRLRSIEDHDDEIRFKGHLWVYVTLDANGNEVAQWEEARREAPYGGTGWYQTAFDILREHSEVEKVVGYYARGMSKPWFSLDREGNDTLAEDAEEGE